MSHVRYITDNQWFRSEDGKGLLAGSPLTYFTVTTAGATILDAIENDKEIPQNHEALTRRLLAVGAIHPTYETPRSAAELTVVIPAFVRDVKALERLQTLVKSLSGSRVIVVDDCSPFEVALEHAEIIRLPDNQGPASARNIGLDAVTTEFVAFVDDDSIVTTQQLCSLAAHLSDESVSAVAPRIASYPGESRLSEYEMFHSPLDLGDAPAVVRPLSRVSYVPAAILVARTSIIKNVNGFDISLRLGEDVDLVWRLAQKKFSVRYDPSIVCMHHPRSTFGSFMRQRRGYGRSAATLDKKHSMTASPLRANLVMLIPAITLLLGFLFLTASLIPIMLLWFVFTLRRTGLRVATRARLALTGWFSTVRLLVSAIMRAWWPVVLLVGQYSLRIGAAFAFSAFIPALFGLLRNKPRHTFSYIALRIVDPMAYGIGVWAGVFRERSVRCLLPVVTRGAIRLRSKV